MISKLSIVARIVILICGVHNTHITKAMIKAFRGRMIQTNKKTELSLNIAREMD